MKLTISIQKLDNYIGSDLPKYATAQSAGLDLKAAIEQDLIIQSGQRILIPTGLAIELPAGYEAQIRPRSGLALNHGITILNSPGTIDADYRGEIKIIIINLSTDDFIVTPGMRIAQMVIAKFIQADLKLTLKLSDSIRNQQGFGSTGQ